MLLAGLNGFALTDLRLTVIAVVSADGFASMDFFKVANIFTKKGKGKLLRNVMFLSLYQSEFKSITFFLCNFCH